MGLIKDWIRQHQLTVFFLVAIVICFGTLFPVILVIPQESTIGQILGYYLAKLGVYSPVLAGMFVARVVQPERQRVPLGRRLLIFLPTWIIAIIIHIANFKLTAPPESTLIGQLILSLPVALLPALVITSALSGADGVKKMLATLVRPKGNIFYYLVALLTFPLIQVLGTVITNIVNGYAWFPTVWRGADLAYTVFITFFSVLFYSGGINEESGWRGFAQKRLQVKFNPLVANLILWVMMVIWHIPNDIVQYQSGGYLLMRIAIYPFITILFGWIYNRTKGSILASAIFHASMNAMNPLMKFFPVTTAGSIILVGFAAIVIICDRMWKKLPPDHPAVYQPPAPAEEG